jgi:hypothetical protein
MGVVMVQGQHGTFKISDGRRSVNSENSMHPIEIADLRAQARLRYSFPVNTPASELGLLESLTTQNTEFHRNRAEKSFYSFS